MMRPAISSVDELPPTAATPLRVPMLRTLALTAGATALLLALALSLTSSVAQPIGRTSAPSSAPNAVTDATQMDFALRPSHGGVYRAEVATAPRIVRLNEPATWVFRVTGRNHRRVPGAAVALQTRLVDRGDSTTATLAARYVGGGRYAVRDVRLTEPGWWNLALVIRGARGTDSLAFNVVIDR